MSQKPHLKLERTDPRCQPVGARDTAQPVRPAVEDLLERLAERERRPRMITENLRAQLGAAEAELKRHMASWEYAFAMGSSCHGQGEHPTHWATRAHTEQLLGRCRDLRARLAEHQAGTPRRSVAAEQL